MTSFVYTSAAGPMPFWSDVQAKVTLPISSSAANVSLPAVTVANLPPGVIINRVRGILIYAYAEDDSAGDNKLVLAGTEHIQVDKTGGTYIDAIKLVADMLFTPGGSFMPGYVLVGAIDIKSEVDGEDTYEFRWEAAGVTAASIHLHMVYTGLLFDFL